MDVIHKIHHGSTWSAPVAPMSPNEVELIINIATLIIILGGLIITFIVHKCKQSRAEETENALRHGLQAEMMSSVYNQPPMPYGQPQMMQNAQPPMMPYGQPPMMQTPQSPMPYAPSPMHQQVPFTAPPSCPTGVPHQTPPKN